jgi:hypothetical protein
MLCYAISSHALLSYQSSPHAAPRGLGITMLLHLEIVSDERQNVLSNAS